MREQTDEQLTTQLARRIALPPVASNTWILQVLDGQEQGKHFQLDDVVTRRALIGQSASCEVQLSDRCISRRHAVIEGDASGVRVVDMGSRNGTWIGEIRVRDAYVRSGEIVRFGDTRIRFSTDGALHTVPTSSEACFARVIGISPEMRTLYPVFQRIAQADVPVLIEGETGTGKEVLAESLHDRSARASGPFMVVDCTTISPTLLEAEFFGHERGAFTGAVTTRAGLFEEANGGTLFIDEIGDLDISLQAKLLRALERKEIRRVGGTQMLRLDVRVIAATRRDLDKEVAARRFRDDLYYRLAVARLELPPLRRRQGDIAFLTRFLWVKLGGDESALSPDIIQRFEGHDWPGNIRELGNAIARQLALGDFEPAAHVQTPSAESGHAGAPFDVLEQIVRSGQAMTTARQKVVDEFERRYTNHMLSLHGGNVTRAAAASGIGRRYFQMVRAKRP
jgi:two-component system, NtrC family, response regulator HydG